ncbi:TetR/AcrR family transcriptional regulator [Streptomyces minutiscleroticus]|uniref:TetR/AcrR family transcriptional regulator n=1 Tax=Streptomyces minutiscleroticus TaxID=68238 RepID=UPI00167C4DC2|nr:TetR family transcriptional regulator [Streptomyces minutiscleroticus]
MADTERPAPPRTAPPSPEPPASSELPQPLASPSYPPPAPVRRSDATRTAILAAARERFAADGYDRATIRAIAKDARIDPSMVMRYFGSKEGLFAAATSFDLRLPELGSLAPEEAGRVLVEHFLDLWEGNDALVALLRVGVAGAAGAERIRHTMFEQQVLPVAREVCPDPEQAAARAALAAAQMLGMALARYVLRFPPTVALAREEVVAWLAPTVQRYLTAPHPGGAL